jgi:hypothetical protein
MPVPLDRLSHAWFLHVKREFGLVASAAPAGSCPRREPIRGVRRYGRATAKAALDLTDRKTADAALRAGRATQQKLAALAAVLQTWPPEAPPAGLPGQRYWRPPKGWQPASVVLWNQVVKPTEALARAQLKAAQPLMR